jgi:hypothetical protein
VCIQNRKVQNSLRSVGNCFASRSNFLLRCVRINFLIANKSINFFLIFLNFCHLFEIQKKNQTKIKFKFLIPGINCLAPSFNLRYIWFRPNHCTGCPRNHMKTFSNIDVSHCIYTIYTIYKSL